MTVKSKYPLAPLVRALNGRAVFSHPLPCGAVVGLCLTGLFSTAAQAQSRYAGEAAALPPVVVTATSRTQPVADVQAAVQVISQRELQSYPGTSLTEALQLAVGVDARANGANSTLAIRGIITNAGSPVLVLVDGLRRTAKYGGVNLNLIALEDVERIEIVRGPMSALYGADATGGVINVVTKSVAKAEPGSGSVRHAGSNHRPPARYGGCRGHTQLCGCGHAAPCITGAAQP
jgi:outer membrane cobalamin receptor